MGMLYPGTINPIHLFITHAHATAIYDTTWRRGMEEGKRVRVRGGKGEGGCMLVTIVAIFP